MNDKSIRFINSNYEELFNLPDGGVIEISFPDRKFMQKCSYIDEYHFRAGYEVFHICQFAEMLEKNYGACNPEQELIAEEAAWKIGTKGYLMLQTCEDGYDFTLLDLDFKDIDGGQLDMPEISILEARNEILNDCKWGMETMYEEYYEMVEEEWERTLDAAEAELSGLDLTEDLGAFSVEVSLQADGLLDVFISREGSSGEHYTDVSAEDLSQTVGNSIAETVAMLIEKI